MDNILLAFGGAAKALGDGKFRMPMVIFGGDGDLSTLKDRFTKNTDFEVPEWPAPCTVRFEHGQNEFIGKKALAGGVGACKMDKNDDEIFVEGVLDLADRYEARIYKMIEDGKLGGSSGSVFHLIERKSLPDGGHEILRWPLGPDMSLTPKPADPRTRIHELKNYDAMKSLSEGWDDVESAIKAVGTLPLADTKVWNGAAAEKRMKKWATDDKGEVDIKKLSRGYARKGDKLSDLGFPFADVIDDKLQAVPRGVIAAGSATMGSRTGKEPDDADAIRKVLAPYYKEMKMTPPWENKKALTIEEFAAKSEYFGECVEESMTMRALSAIQDQLYYGIIWGVVYDDTLTPQQKSAKIEGAFAEFVEYAQIVFNALLGDDGTPDDELKSLREIWCGPNEFSTQPLRQALKHATLSLADTLERWDGEVYKFLSQGAKANQVLSSKNQESAKAGYAAILEAKSHMENIMDRAGVDYSEPGDTDNTNDDDEDDKKSIEIARLNLTIAEAKRANERLLTN